MTILKQAREHEGIQTPVSVGLALASRDLPLTASSQEPGPGISCEQSLLEKALPNSCSVTLESVFLWAVL